MANPPSIPDLYRIQDDVQKLSKKYDRLSASNMRLAWLSALLAIDVFMLSFQSFVRWLNSQ